MQVVLKGGNNVGQNLALLANYFIAYEVTWAGAMIGLFQACIGGFLFGYVLAKLINLIVRSNKNFLIKKIELNRSIALEED